MEKVQHGEFEIRYDATMTQDDSSLRTWLVSAGFEDEADLYVALFHRIGAESKEHVSSIKEDERPEGIKKIHLKKLQALMQASGGKTAIPVPTGAPCEASKSGRTRNRWGDGIDVASAGSRNFFPDGWVPEKAELDSIKPFGHEDADIVALEKKAEQIEEKLKLLKLNTSKAYSAVIVAYTEEKATNLYGKFNWACRSVGPQAEVELKMYRDYHYHFKNAINTLPNFAGTTYRGAPIYVSSSTYAPGMIITWQQNSSTARSTRVTVTFLNKQGKVLIGTIFVIKVKAGKDIQIFSAFPEEEEVLLPANSFFKVLQKLENAEDKAAMLEGLSGWDLSQLDVFVLQQM